MEDIKENSQVDTGSLTFEDFKNQVIKDYRLANASREASYIARKEVLTGKAKFGITGDGKEIAQIALAKYFDKGDFRSGYYRDQTFMMAIGELTLEQFFAQLYADPNLEHEPMTGGRQMNSHFATRSLDEKGQWKDLTDKKNSSVDASPTGSQMPRLVGLAYASRLYREIEALHEYTQFSNKGKEVAFGMIGNASAAEGMFWEALNACGLLNAPVSISIWDDEYGISVANDYQLTKSNISSLLKGFEYDPEVGQGYYIYTPKGWDYPGLIKAYEEGIRLTREYHIPTIFHIQEMTQPQGHSTSGSHERYKSKERLQWEQEWDCINQMRNWMLENDVATEEEIDQIETEAKEEAKEAKNEAYKAFINPIKQEIKEGSEMIGKLAEKSQHKERLQQIQNDLKKTMDVFRRTIVKAIHDALRVSIDENIPERKALVDWQKQIVEVNSDRYNTYLHSHSDYAATNIEAVEPEYDADAEEINGYQILNNFFDEALKRDPKIFAFGEDLGKIGGVNQGMAGLQEKYGELRVADTGIRETTIIGQGIGTAMRGLRPIAEIQYLDYVLYALQTMSDDLATVQYRSRGGQKAPLIIRTRGHRFEGIWHSGSHMGAIINACRGMIIGVPRNMLQAAGLYNTLLKSDEPGLIIERLNAYRSKEKHPSNLGDVTVPVGVPEVLTEGTDVTIVTYGACVGVAEETVTKLDEVGISTELIDVQTLLPFDLHHSIIESLKKTNRVVFLDEDAPGGANGFMMKKVLEEQGGYWHLDSEPRTVTSHAHRPAYASDGDYFSKPQAEDVFDTIYGLMHEADPNQYPDFY